MSGRESSHASPDISLIVPVYNGAATLPTLVERCQAVCEAAGLNWELILVDDFSRDDSWAAIGRLASACPKIRGIALARNYGQHNALLCGVWDARAPVVVTLDDDLQNPPEEIPKLLARIGEGFDCVYGTPIVQRNGVLRGLASTITKMVLQKSMGAHTARRISAFRAFRTGVREAFRHVQEPYVNLDVLLTWGAGRFTSVPVRHDERAAGVSNYTIGKLLTHAINMMSGFSAVPLRCASFLGLLLAFLGALLTIVVLLSYMIVGPRVPGFAFLASTICLFSGAQLLFIGILGEYLARTHFRTMGQPAYFIQARCGQ